MSAPAKTATIHDKRSVNIGIDENRREDVAKKLSSFLASTYVLYMKTLYYHWNVTGPHFHSLHEMFEEQYEDLHAAGDELAERIRALGSFTPGTIREYLELSSVKEDSALPRDADTMVKNLLEANEQCSCEARDTLKTAEEAEDEVTVDMMVARMTFHDKTAWMLRSVIG